MYNGKAIKIDDFSGGLNTSYKVLGNGVARATNLDLNEASDLDNIIIYPGGKGIRSRDATTIYVSGLNGAVIGLHMYTLTSGSTYSVTVAGSKIYRGTTPVDGAPSDITGSVTITSSASNLWDMFTFSDTVVAFGGPPTSPDAPFKCTTAGNASALGGTPPSAYGGLSAANRAFAFRTSANPSTLYWSVLANAEDWTSAGSGSSVIGTLNDNSPINAVVEADRNSLLVFKNNAIYQVPLTSAPFSNSLVAKGTGCVGKKAAIVIDGVTYFVNQRKELQAYQNGTITTLGTELQRYFLTTTDLSITQLQRQTGRDYDWIVIHNAGLVMAWDLKNKCFLKHTTGYSTISASVYVPFYSPIGFASLIFGDASGGLYYTGGGIAGADFMISGYVPFTSYWQSGYFNPGDSHQVIQVQKVTAVHNLFGGGSPLNTTFSYNYDYASLSNSITFDMLSSTRNTISETKFLTGRGNAFAFKISFTNASPVTYVDNALVLRSLTLLGKVYGQKTGSAS